MNLLMNYLPYILMVIGGVVAVIGMSHQKKGEAWGQPVSVLGALIAVAAAIWNLTDFFNTDSNRMKAEGRFQYVAGKICGQAIGEKFAGKKVVIAIDPLKFTDYYGDPLPENQKREDYTCKGLIDGIAGRCDVDTVYPEVPKRQRPANDNGMGMMMGMDDPTANPVNINKALEKKAKKADVIVLELPIMAMQLSGILGMSALKGKQVVMINQSFTTESENWFKTAATTKENKNAPTLAMSVVTRYNADFDSTRTPADDKKCFDMRYSLITPENYMTEIKIATTVPAN